MSCSLFPVMCLSPLLLWKSTLFQTSSCASCPSWLVYVSSLLPEAPLPVPHGRGGGDRGGRASFSKANQEPWVPRSLPLQAGFHHYPSDHFSPASWRNREKLTSALAPESLLCPVPKNRAA